jgi:hypothetical protein
MSSRNFIILLFCSLVAGLALIALLPLLPGMKTDPQAAWSNGLYRDKINALHKLPPRRIFVVAGSSSLFSLDTQVLSRVVGKPVVNLATHAGLGLPYILDRAGREIGPGDIIIFTPEYPILQMAADPNQLTLAYVAFFDRPYIATRPLAEQSHFYLGYGFLDSLLETLKTLRTGVQPGRPDLTFDALGNARGNTVANSVKDTSIFAPSSEPKDISPDAMIALRKFAGRARAQHARIIAFPTALIHQPGWDTPRQRAFRQKLRKTFAELGMVSLGDDSTGWIEPGGMYDSAVHANDAGRAIYTGRLARLLCREIACAHPPQ